MHARVALEFQGWFLTTGFVWATCDEHGQGSAIIALSAFSIAEPARFRVRALVEGAEAWVPLVAQRLHMH